MTDKSLEHLTMITKEQHKALVPAFRRTSFEYQTRLGDWLPIDYSILPMALITAYNPGCIKRDPSANRRANNDLYETLVKLGYFPTPAMGIDKTRKTWGREPGWLIGHEYERTQSIASVYGQIAYFIICGPSGKDRYINWTGEQYSPIKL